MKIFLICPVRNITPELQEDIETYVVFLERQGHMVHWPPRDTKQDDAVGSQICAQNYGAILGADRVDIAWDGKSQGCLFDLGIAYALRKPIRPVIGLFPRQSQEKSFQNVVYDWQENGLPQGE